MSALERAYEEMRDRLEPIGVFIDTEGIHYKGTLTDVKPYTTKAECKKIFNKYIKHEKLLAIAQRASEPLPLFNQETE